MLLSKVGSQILCCFLIEIFGNNVLFFELFAGILQDVHIVPVSISYEKVVDGTFVDESLGKPKAFESFVRASKAIWKTMHSRYGNVRVDFNAPFRLSDFLAQNRSKQLSFSSPSASASSSWSECNNNHTPFSRSLSVNSPYHSAPVQSQPAHCVACSCSGKLNSYLPHSPSFFLIPITLKAFLLSLSDCFFFFSFMFQLMLQFMQKNPVFRVFIC